MKLVSNFHDYYDGCITTIDPLHIYKRRQQKIPLDSDIRDMFDIPIAWFQRVSGFSVIIGFCGELYTGVINPIAHDVYWSFDAYLKGYDTSDREIKAVKNTFTFKPKINLKRFFDVYKTPCFVIESGLHDSTTRITVNPCLRDYNFYKVVDPWTAYQEIQMFVGNNLVNDDNKQVKLSDKTLQGKHGFGEMSFRKRK